MKDHPGKKRNYQWGPVLYEEQVLLYQPESIQDKQKAEMMRDIYTEIIERVIWSVNLLEVMQEKEMDLKEDGRLLVGIYQLRLLLAMQLLLVEFYYNYYCSNSMDIIPGELPSIVDFIQNFPLLSTLIRLELELDGLAEEKLSGSKSFGLSSIISYYSTYRARSKKRGIFIRGSKKTEFDGQRQFFFCCSI
ncbi:MAG: hypothetical protein EZS28_013289 [Streblomastix strix]|uniref:Uncharacterized protein n=1 Tax=Streblomastix strix TaxID=222440 RepID=A0A5J4W8G9_9EUKA|nr:MAG: hypothetical protein EZS28_013289 [Streblomastix strix]